MQTSSTQYIHPTSIKGEGFRQGDTDTYGFKLSFGRFEICVFDNKRDYLSADETVTPDELVAALRKAANDIAKLQRKEANK